MRPRNGPLRQRRSGWTAISVAVGLPCLLGLILVLLISRNSADGVADAAGSPLDAARASAGLVKAALGVGTPVSPDNLLQAGQDAAQHSMPRPLLQHALGSPSSPIVDAAPPAREGPKPSLFLFIGILSGRGYRHRRLAVREAWANGAQQVEAGLSQAKFILSEDEKTPQVQKELEAYDDMAFLAERTNYKSILFKTFFIFQYALETWDVKYVLKTDDDAFVNVTPLIIQLRLLCTSKDCAAERIYLGDLVANAEVMMQPGHKWNNIVFHNHTGLKTYPTYAMGGGYVLSADVVATLVEVNARMKLKFTPIEDATVGFWLMAMDLRFIHHPKVLAYAAPCCFKAPVRREGQHIVTRFQLADDIQEDLCSNNPWLVLHKIDSPTKMRFVGNQVRDCPADSWQDARAMAPSLAPFLPRADGHELSQEDRLHQEAVDAISGTMGSAAQAHLHKGPEDEPLSDEQKAQQAADAENIAKVQEQLARFDAERTARMDQQEQLEALLAGRLDPGYQQQPGAGGGQARQDAMVHQGIHVIAQALADQKSAAQQLAEQVVEQKKSSEAQIEQQPEADAQQRQQLPPDLPSTDAAVAAVAGELLPQADAGAALEPGGGDAAAAAAALLAQQGQGGSEGTQPQGASEADQQQASSEGVQAQPHTQPEQGAVAEGTLQQNQALPQPEQPAVEEKSAAQQLAERVVQERAGGAAGSDPEHDADDAAGADQADAAQGRVRHLHSWQTTAMLVQ